jgi:hypothetical protein
MAPAAAAAVGDDANTNKQHCYYNGVDTVPCTVTHLKIDPSVKIIPPALCLHCVHLVEVELPDGLEMIGGRAFSNCLGLKSIDIPSTVTDIGERAFQHCCSLKVITLPQSLLKLGEEAFEDCRALEIPSHPPGSSWRGLSIMVTPSVSNIFLMSGQLWPSTPVFLPRLLRRYCNRVRLSWPPPQQSSIMPSLLGPNPAWLRGSPSLPHFRCYVLMSLSMVVEMVEM